MNRRQFLARQGMVWTGLLWIPKAAGQIVMSGSPARGSAAAGGGEASPTPELAWYKFTEGSGTTVADSSVKNITGNVGTGATWVTGKSGSGYGLDGDGTNRMMVGASACAYGVNKLSITCWFKITAYPAAFGYVCCTVPPDGAAVAASIYLDQYENLYMEQFGGYTTCYRYIAGPAAPSGWHHIAATYDNSGTNAVLVMYYDNALQTGTTFFDATGPANYDNGTFMIGGTAATSNVGNVIVDDVRVYNRLINSTEIGQIYNDPQ